MILGRRETKIIKNYEMQEKKPNIVVRSAYRDEWDDAMALAWRTFMRFEADDYSTEGIKSFQDFITDTTLYRMFVMGAYQLFCALDGKKLVGMISLRNETHISLLFVDASYHKKGVGRALIDYVGDYVLLEEGFHRLTVNAAPYAVDFYHKLGFRDTDTEKISDGIRYTSMEKKLG